MGYEKIDHLSKEELMDLCEMYAKNWLAMDGVWFLSVEQKYGMEEAMEHDVNAWRLYTVTEAKRIKEFLQLPKRAGIEGLKAALSLRMYALLNEDSFLIDGNSLIYRMTACRVQDARFKKGLPYHPCKQVGIVEYTYFAKEIDERFETTALSCYPDITDDTCRCSWKFTLRTGV